jgi:hypothetical protein
MRPFKRIMRRSAEDGAPEAARPQAGSGFAGALEPRIASFGKLETPLVSGFRPRF